MAGKRCVLYRRFVTNSILYVLLYNYAICLFVVCDSQIGEQNRFRNIFFLHRIWFRRRWVTVSVRKSRLNYGANATVMRADNRKIYSLRKRKFNTIADLGMDTMKIVKLKCLPIIINALLCFILCNERMKPSRWLEKLFLTFTIPREILITIVDGFPSRFDILFQSGY